MVKHGRVVGWVIACCLLGSVITVPAQVLSPELPEAASADEVVAAAKLASTRLAPKRLTEYNITGLDERVTGLESIEPMDVVHLVYILDPTRNPDFEYDVDVNGTRNALAACETLGVCKLVVASSDTAYGLFEGTPDYLTEDAPLRGTPGFSYSANKAEVEALVAEFAERVRSCTVVVLRPCIVMGPNADNVLGRTLRQPVMFSVRGYDPIMQLIHEEDVAEAFYLALVRDVQGAYNVACDAGMRYSQVAGVMDKPMVPLPVWLVYPLVELLFRLRLLGFGRSQLDYIRYPLSIDPDKIMKEMGFAPRYTSRQALEAFRDSH